MNNGSSGKVVVMSKAAWVNAFYRWRHQRPALDVRHAWRKSTMGTGHSHLHGGSRRRWRGAHDAMVIAGGSTRHGALSFTGWSKALQLMRPGVLRR